MVEALACLPRSSSSVASPTVRTVWVSFDTIGRECLEAAAEAGADVVGVVTLPGPIDPNRSGQCAFAEVAARHGANAGRDRRRQFARDARGSRRARPRPDLRRRLVADRSRAVSRTRARRRVRNASDPAASSPRQGSDSVGHPLRAGANGSHALRDRGRNRRLRRHRRPGRSSRSTPTTRPRRCSTASRMRTCS